MLSLKDYKSATLNVFDIGTTVATLIKSLEKMDSRFNRTQLTIAGYSLGAHAAGFAGHLLDGELGEIIALDAAGPLFTIPADVGNVFRLDKGDAVFVQVMHTSMGTLGTHMKLGHADFYPNGGVSPQSNCVLMSQTENPKNSECFFDFWKFSQQFIFADAVSCSHSSVVRFFKQSLNPDYAFIGHECLSYRFFVLGLCSQNTKSRFGIYSEKVPGDFFLTTYIVYPYVRRIGGEI